MTRNALGTGGDGVKRGDEWHARIRTERFPDSRMADEAKQRGCEWR